MKSLYYHIILMMLLLVGQVAQAKEYTVQSVPNVQVADRTQYVSDPDNYLGADAKAHINNMLAQLRDSNSVEAVVVMLPSIGNEDIDNFATELFMHWGIGKADNDNGLLIIAVMDQRQIVFRTGYGIEGVLPDVLCSRIIRQYITPAFRNGDYDKGMTDAVQQTLRIVMTPEASAELMSDSADEPIFDEVDKQLLMNILYGYIIISVLISLLITIRLNRTIRRYRSESYECYKELNSSLTMLQVMAVFVPLWGIFNLIHCTSTMKKMRNKARRCSECGTLMHRLSEQEDNYFLTPQEDAEERIGSVDYDVWMCDMCRNTEVLRFDNKHTGYSECPCCHAKTYSLSLDHIVMPATTLAAGRGEKIYTCSYCKTRKVLPYIIPKIVVSSSSGRGGGFGGGGFGGGMTGGGGARGGW